MNRIGLLADKKKSLKAKFKAFYFPLRKHNLPPPPVVWPFVFLYVSGCELMGKVTGGY